MQINVYTHLAYGILIPQEHVKDIDASFPKRWLTGLTIKTIDLDMIKYGHDGYYRYMAAVPKFRYCIDGYDAVPVDTTKKPPSGELKRFCNKLKIPCEPSWFLFSSISK